MISYNKLWKLLIDIEDNKTDLSKRCNISPSTISRMSKGLHVSTEVLEKICIDLKCSIEDIIEIRFK